MTITLTQYKTDIKATNALLTECASTSWYAVKSLEGISSYSELVKSKKIKPGAYQSIDEEGVTCWRCDGDIHHSSNEGMAIPYKAGPKFNDHWECKGKHNTKKVMCAACDRIADRAYHPNFKLNALFTGNAAYQLTLDEDLISFLVEPPPPPFLFTMAENNSQHMVWLSDFTLDSDLISIQKSRSRYLVSRKHAYEIAGRYYDILTKANKIRECLEYKASLSTPFESSRREINTKSANNLLISNGILMLRNHKDGDSDLILKMRAELSEMIAELDKTPMNYGLWYLVSMFTKMLTTSLKPKPASDWQKLKQPK